MGQTAEGTDWRGKAKGQWRAMEQAAVRRGWTVNRTKDMERNKVYDRGWSRPESWEKGSPGCSLLSLVTLLCIHL